MRQLDFLRSRIARQCLFGFAAIYLLFAVGVFKSTHYCMGRTSSITLFSSESKKCICEKYERESHGCCDDERVLIQIEDDHQPVLAFNLNVPDIYVLGDIYTERVVATGTPSTGEVYFGTDTSPPVPLYQRNCSLVFYESEG